jgi:parvulin-like peptidyl-prolyl isomerase
MLFIMSSIIEIGEQKLIESGVFPLLAKYGMLPQLAREVIIDQAIAHVICTDEEKNAARSRFYQQNQITNEEQVNSWLQKNGMNAEQLEYLFLRDLKLEKFKQETWENKVESHFLQVKTQLDKVIYSLIRTKDVGIAQELFFRLQDQENTFAELAKQYSQGAEAETGGVIGPVELSAPHPQISHILKSIKPGQLWPPTQVGEWIVILRLEKYLSCELDSYTRQRLRNDLFQQWLMEQMQTIKFIPEQLPVNNEELSVI